MRVYKQGSKTVVSISFQEWLQTGREMGFLGPKPEEEPSLTVKDREFLDQLATHLLRRTPPSKEQLQKANELLGKAFDQAPSKTDRARSLLGIPDLEVAAGKALIDLLQIIEVA